MLIGVVLSLRQIEIVRAVLLTGSISGAARMLNVSSPTVSRMLRHAESLAGMAFFDRTASGFVPTPEILAILEDLETIHDGILRVNRHLSTARRPTEGRLAIGVSPGLGVTLAPRAIAAMHRNWPGVEIEFDVLHRAEVVNQLILQTVDLALAIFDLPDPRVESQLLGRGRLVCLAPSDHHFAKRDSIGVAELAGEPLIGFNERQFQQAMIDDLMSRAGVQLRPKIRVRLTVSAYFMVANGVGLALLDSFTTAAPMDGVKVVPLREDATFELRVFRNRNAPLSQISAAFLEHLKQLL